MTIRDELEYVSGRLREYNDAETGARWDVFSSAAYRFLRDHGPALVEALEIAEERICCDGWDCGCRGATRAEHHAAMIRLDAARGES